MVCLGVFVYTTENKLWKTDIDSLRFRIEFGKININQCPNCSGVFFISGEIVYVGRFKTSRFTCLQQ